MQYYIQYNRKFSLTVANISTCTDTDTGTVSILPKLEQ